MIKVVIFLFLIYQYLFATKLANKLFFTNEIQNLFLLINKVFCVLLIGIYLVIHYNFNFVGILLLIFYGLNFSSVIIRYLFVSGVNND